MMDQKDNGMMKMLVVESPGHGLPQGAASLFQQDGWTVTTSNTYQNALELADSMDAVLLSDPVKASEADRRTETKDFSRLMRWIDARGMAAILVADVACSAVEREGCMIDVVTPSISPAELRGRFAMIARYQKRLTRMQAELHNMEQLSKRLGEHFREVDQEMGLAARLQRDFLPQVGGPIRNVQFATVYRPASWVSGDIFDVFRIDEDHTGFYVADAVGHGMAAGLLTIFIKRAIESKRLQKDGYCVLSPSETLSALNKALADQSLPNCQFVTACYGWIDHRTMTFRYARGGHPYPLLITAEGCVSELKTTGGLLGIFPDEEFPVFETKLHPGDKLLMYTDGVELAFRSHDGASLDTNAYHGAFQSFAALPIRKMVQHMERRLDAEVGSLYPHDDVTIVGLEILS